MARKGENIYKRKDGRWEGRYGAGRLPEGKTRYISVYGRSYKEVKEKLLTRKREEYITGERMNLLPRNLTIYESVRLWISENRIKWKESTLATYQSIAEKHILPLVGHYSASSFDDSFWKNYFSELRKKNLSEAYLHQIFILLGQIFRFLEKKYHCRLELPSITFAVTTRLQHAPEMPDIRKLEEYLRQTAEKGDSVNLGILLSGCSGIRIGELCALQWKDIDFEKGTIIIRKTMQRIRTFHETHDKNGTQLKTGTKIIITAPKSRNSVREIPLPEYLMELLKKAMERRETEDRESYLLKGKKKEYMEPRTLQYRFQALLEQLGIPTFNFHMLRHIFATNCISQGFDMKTLSELLGHSNVSTTMRIYVHSNMDRKKLLMSGYRMAA